MKRNFMLTKYYKSSNPVELITQGVRSEYICIDKAVQELINDEIDYFKYEYNEHDILNNQKVHITHTIKKEGERYYEKIQEQRVHNISLS